MSEKRIVEVYKADIPLQDGESVQVFERKLRDTVQKKFGLPRSEKKAGIYAYVRAVFSDRLVMEKDVEGPGRELKLWSVDYKRADNGEFSFGTPSEVKEQVNFVPVSKSVEQPERIEIENVWKDLFSWRSPR